MKSKMKYFIVLITLLFLTISVASASDNTTTHTNTDTLEQTTHTLEKVATSTEAKKIEKQDNNKSIKTDTENVNYYVSDSEGSDNNTGAQDSPFKTIQTALDNTKVGKTNNIYIKNGIYHGLGNTNLTIDGSKTINFIGENKDDTVFYGNASYDINETEYYWGSSKNWYYYENETGNWFMNITKGLGKITLNNLTISHMYSIGAGPGQYHRGDSISLYPIANVDNYGTLEVNNVLFDQNYGGVGSAIRNNEKATLTVSNSEFSKNQKSSSSGNMGIIFNKGTTTITNSNFHDNYARWGTILNNNKLTITNSILQNNIGYDGGSTYKYGAGIAYNTAGSDFFSNDTSIKNIETNIFNNTFINCDQTSIYGHDGDVTIIGNTFKDTTGIRIGKKYPLTESNKTVTIENNTFDSIKGSTIDTDLGNSDPKYFTIDLYDFNNNINVLNNQITNTNGTIISTYSGNIINNTIKSIGNSTSIKISGKNENTKTVTGNLLYSPINIDTSNTIISDNKVITTDEYAIIANTTNAKNNNITNNYLLSHYAGNNAVKTNTQNRVENNLPDENDENIYVNPDETEAKEGTLANPTTLKDALTKINNNKSIIILQGSNNKYNINETIDITNGNVKEETTTFNIESLTEVEFTTNTTMFNIGPEYNVTISNIIIQNQTITTNMIQNKGNLTLKDVTIKQVIVNIMTGLITNDGTLNFINSTIDSNRMPQSQNFITNTKTVNILENNLIYNNYMSEGSLIKNNNNNAEVNIIGNNRLEKGTTNRGNLIALGGNVNIIGNNTFTDTLGSYLNNQNLKIDGANKITNIRTVNNFVLMYATNLTINGENIFENCNLMQSVLLSGQNFIINGSNVFNNSDKFASSSNNGIINGSNIFNNVTTTTLMTVGSASQSNTLLINGSNTFTNNINTRQSTFITIAGYLQITGNNVFENNSMGTLIDHRNGAVDGTDNLRMNITGTQFINNNISLNGIFYLYGSSREGNSSISENYFINNNFTEDASLVNIYHRITGTGKLCTYNLTFENNLIDGIIAENGGAISINEYEGVPSELSIINNTFKNIKSENETINLPKLEGTTIENNTYTNCTIGLTDFKLESELDGQTLVQNTLIPLNISAGLLHPEYYDNNIMENLTYEIYVNNNLKQETQEENTNITEGYIAETDGVLNIYAKMNKMSNQTNNITVTIIKPLDTEIIVTVPDENTVNKTTPMTIMLFDEEGNLIRNTTINMTINNKTEEVALVNGAIVYDFTPVTVGNTTIKFVFAGNDTLNPTETEAIINVVADKDKIIEDLNKNLTETTEKLENTTQKAENLEKQLKDANRTIDNQKATLDNLNKTLTQTQKDLQNANKKITEQNQTINNLNKQLTDANNKINTLNKSNNDLNNKLADANKKIDTLTKQNAELEKQLADLNQKVDALTKTVDNLNKTVAARDNTIKELTTKVATKITVTKINTTTVGSTVTVTGKVTDKNGKALNNMPVSIKINTGTTKVVTNANGVYKYTTSAWSVGTSNVTVSTIANDKYTSSSAKTTFKVNKAKPVLKINSISAVKYKDKVTVTGSLMDNNNKAINGAQITLKINSKSVKVKTGKDGSFTYTTSATSMGTNNVTATYNGNTKYNKVTGKTTFKVNKQNLILTVDRVASGLKYKDPLVVGGRLVDGNGKAVANTQVSLKFNGKTYKAKTDKNGYYKVTTRATTMDKNNLTVTYAGNKYYNKATAKTTFTVAKQDIVITFNTVKYSNGKVTISGTFTDRNRHALMNSLARITLNGKQGTAKTDKTGTFTYTTKANKGTYKVTLAYPGNARYNAYSKTSTVKTA